MSPPAVLDPPEFTEVQAAQLVTVLRQHGAPVIEEMIAERLELVREERAPTLDDHMIRSGINAGSPMPPTPAQRAKAATFSMIIMALAASDADKDKAIHHVVDVWKLDKNHLVVRALESGTSTAGGFLIPENLSTEVIDLLSPRVIVRMLGAETVDLTGGTAKVPRLSAGAAAFWIGESQDITVSQQTFGMLNLSSKKLACLIPISNDMIRRRPGVNTIVRNDAVRTMRVAEDLAEIRAVGSEHRPTGLRNLIAAANQLAATAADTLTSITSDLSRLVLALEENDIAFETPGWMFAPRTRQRLMTIRDTNGNFAFRPEMLTGRLWGFPFGVTTQIPVNLGGGSDETEVYLVDFSEFVIGEETQIMIDVSGDATYQEAGNLVSAFSRDQVVMRLIRHLDTGLRHDLAAAVLTDAIWIP